MSEELFPRGKLKIDNKASKKLKRRDAGNDTLFLEPASKKSNKHKFDDESTEDDVLVSHKLDSEEKIDQVKNQINDYVEVLNKVKNSQPESLVLGCVQEIQDHVITVALPHCQKGQVKANRISDVFTSKIQNCTEADMPIMYPLSKMFHVGQLVVASIIKAPDRIAKLSLEPRIVNKYVHAKNIKNGLILPVAIKSKEDHGYTVDVGKNSITGFLPFTELEKDKKKLETGAVLRCAVIGIRGKGKIITFSNKNKIMRKSKINASWNYNIDMIQPGMVAPYNISEQNELGSCGKFLGFDSSVATISEGLFVSRGQSDDLEEEEEEDEPETKKQKVDENVLPGGDEHKKPKYKNANKTFAMVLFINPFTKHIALSTSALLQNSVTLGKLVQNYQEVCPVGSKCKAVVKKICKGIGVFFKIGGKKNISGFAPFYELDDTKTEDLYGNYMVGKSYPARVNSISSLEGTVGLCLKPSVVERKFFLWEEIQPGMKLDCRIVNVGSDGLLVSLQEGTSQMRGLVPYIHLSDIKITKPEKKFNETQIITCRVLTCDPVKRRIHLTHKKSLVNTKDDPITEYSQLNTGDIVTGFINSVKPSGVFVKFFGQVHGYVPRRELGELVDPQNPTKDFTVGTIKKCRVLKCEAGEQRLLLSFITNAKPKPTDKAIQIKTDIKLGSPCDVLITDKIEDGFSVEISSKGKSESTKAFLDKMHLSDFPTLANAWFEHLKPGMTLKNCIYNSNQHLLKVSHKRSLRDNTHQFEDLVIDQYILGYITSVKPFGVFVQTGNGLTALCPKSLMANSFVESTDGLFAVGESVIGKIKNIDVEKKEFVVSLKPKDCNKPDLMNKYMSEYVSEKNELIEMFYPKSTGKLSTGSKVKIEKINSDDGSCIIQGLPKSLEGVLLDYKKGPEKKTPTYVLNSDLASNKITLLQCENKIVKLKKNSMGKMKKILYEDEDILVASVTVDDDETCLVLTPSKRHPNIRNHKNTLPEEFEVDLTYNDAHGVVIANISQESTPSIRNTKFVGSVITITENELILRGNQDKTKYARLHISNIENSPENYSKPLERYREGDIVHCKVLRLLERFAYNQLFDSWEEKPSRGNVYEVVLKGFKRSDDLFKVGDTCIAYTTQKECNKRGEEKLIYASLAENVEAAFPLTFYSSDPNELNELKESYPSGVAVHCKIIENEQNYCALAVKGAITDIDGNDLATIQEGAICNCEIISYKYGSPYYLVQIYGHKKAMLYFTDLSDEYKYPLKGEYSYGNFIRCRVVKSNLGRFVSSRKSYMTKNYPIDKIVDKLIESEDQLSVGDIVRGFIFKFVEDDANDNNGVLVSLGRNIQGFAPEEQCIMDKEQKYLKQYLRHFQVVTVAVMGINADKEITVSLLECDTGYSNKFDQIIVPEKASDEETVEVPVPIETKTKKKKKINKKKLEDSKKFAEVVSVEQNEPVSMETTEEPGFLWGDELSKTIEKASDNDSGVSDSESEEEQKAPTKQKKWEKEAEKIEQEREIIEREKELMDTSRLPQTAAEWDKYMLANPQNSMLWVKYMAFYLHSTEVDSARLVAERALKSIDFSDESERLNIWISLLNLENMHGTSDSLRETVSNALAHNDPLKVNLKLVEIYEQSGKLEEADDVYKKMLKKFRFNENVWLSYITYLMRQGNIDEANNILKRSLQSLNKKQHINILSKFGQLEFKIGDPERGCTVFENILSSYPKRADIWLMYINLLIKANRIDDARNALQRVTTLSFSTKNMKTLFKQYIDFEIKYGDESNIAEIKRKALDYMESKTTQIDNDD